MTCAELLAIPDDGLDCELVRGEVRIRGLQLSGYQHAKAMIRIICRLSDWIDRQPQPRGEILGYRASRITHQVADICGR